MPRLSEKAKKLIEENVDLSSRELVELLALELNETYSNVTTNNYKNKYKQSAPPIVIDDINNIIEPVTDTSEPLYVKNHQYQEVREVTEGDLLNTIKDALKGEITIDSELLERMKRGYPKMPFGGIKVGSGGWNSITYAIFEVLEKSNLFYVKKE